METKNLITEEQADTQRLTMLQKFMGLSEEESRNLVNILTQPTPKELIKSRAIRGGSSAQYVEGFRFIQRFNDAFGFLWSFEVPKIIREGEEIISQGRWSLQIPGRTITRKHPDGMEETLRFDGFSIIKEQFGSAIVKRWTKDGPVQDKKGNHIKNAKGEYLYNYRAGDVMDLGNDYKASSTDAMKKCGTELGAFLDVYGAREAAEVSGPSDKQLEAFYLRADSCGMNKEAADKWAEEQLGKPLKEADQQRVLGLVADLIDLAKGGQK